MSLKMKSHQLLYLTIAKAYRLGETKTVQQKSKCVVLPFSPSRKKLPGSHSLFSMHVLSVHLTESFLKAHPHLCHPAFTELSPLLSRPPSNTANLCSGNEQLSSVLQKCVPNLRSRVIM